MLQMLRKMKMFYSSEKYNMLQMLRKNVLQ